VTQTRLRHPQRGQGLGAGLRADFSP